MEMTIQSGDPRLYVTFQLGEEMFALEIETVREVLDFPAVTKVPQTPDFLRGVINLRGNVVPVVDLRLKFGMPPTEKTVDTRVVIVEVIVDEETTVLGALADSVREVIEMTPDQIGPAPKIGTRLRTDFIKGMGRRNDEFIIILDINYVFSSDELAIVQSVDQEMPAAMAQGGGSDAGMAAADA